MKVEEEIRDPRRDLCRWRRTNYALNLYLEPRRSVVGEGEDLIAPESVETC